MWDSIVSVPDLCLFIFFGRSHRGLTAAFSLPQPFSVGLAVEYSSCGISVMNLDLYVCCFHSFMS